MGILAIICAILLVILIPNEIWKGLLYIGLILLVGFIGFWATVAYIADL